MVVGVVVGSHIAEVDSESSPSLLALPAVGLWAKRRGRSRVLVTAANRDNCEERTDYESIFHGRENIVKNSLVGHNPCLVKLHDYVQTR